MKETPSGRIDELFTLFRESLNVEVPSEHTDLLEEGLLDSLSLVELLVQLEEKFEVTVSIEDLEIDDFRSIRRITRFLESCK